MPMSTSSLDMLKERIRKLESMVKDAQDETEQARAYGEEMRQACARFVEATKIADQRYEEELQKNIDLERKLQDEQKVRQIMREAMAEMSEKLKRYEEGYKDWVVITNQGDAKHYFAKTDNGAAYLAREAGYSVYHVYTKQEYEAERNG